MEYPKFDENQLVTRRKTARLFDCSIETLRRMEAKGLLHPLKINKRFVRYRLSDIKALLNQSQGGDSDA